jgi:hypothetical protein
LPLNIVRTWPRRRLKTRRETDETGQKTKQEWQDSNPRPAVLEFDDPAPL